MTTHNETSINLDDEPVVLVMFLKIFFWLVGWVSGGILTLIIVSIINLFHLMPKNENFVVGCVWGTCGMLMGQFMVKMLDRSPMV